MIWQKGACCYYIKILLALQLFTIRESCVSTKYFSLTSQSFLDTVVRCETISLPESPRIWTILLAELVVPAVCDWFAVQLTVMCWKDVWLCNRRNLSWTTSTPAYPNYQRQKSFIGSLRKLLADVWFNKRSSINPQMCSSVLPCFHHVAD